jgi:alkanesulfonate monooxygenase SsuD/methylene tetrahydromethanopterin reductase-like flavin-dependent oxidoreductase (luciferase family)
MRLGVTLPAGDEVGAALAAEAVGIPFVEVAAATGTEATVAAAVAATTSAVRIVVRLHLGDEHPTTLAEEIAVVDNVSNGRVAVLADLGALDVDAAVDDLTLLRDSWLGRPLHRTGPRWQVAAGLPGHRAPPAVIVSPSPAQLVVPLWICGAAADDVTAALAVPSVAEGPADVDPQSPVAPGRAQLTGDVDADRALVLAWSAAGATHILCELGGSATVESLARWLIPEVAMIDFPRVVTETPLPAPWPERATR